MLPEGPFSDSNLSLVFLQKLKPEVKFQYGGCLFSETRSSNNSAVDWNISSKFGEQIDSDIPKWVPLLKLKPEVQYWPYGLSWKIDML